MWFLGCNVDFVIILGKFRPEMIFSANDFDTRLEMFGNG